LLYCRPLDNLSVGKLRVEGYLKLLKDNNIPINEDIILRTDSEDLNSEAIFDNNTIDGVLLWMKTTPLRL
jgi:LacI family transcriptional regulator